MKALSVNISPAATKAIKRISEEDPEGSWDRAPYYIKKALYDEFGQEDLAEFVGKDRVLDFEIKLYKEGELSKRQLASSVASNPSQLRRLL
jgi:hypothetical protein